MAKATKKVIKRRRERKNIEKAVVVDDACALAYPRHSGSRSLASPAPLPPVPHLWL